MRVCVCDLRFNGFGTPTKSPLFEFLIHSSVSALIRWNPPVSLVSHAGKTDPSPTSAIDTAMSGMTAVMASVQARQVSNISWRRIVIGSFISFKRSKTEVVGR